MNEETMISGTTGMTVTETMKADLLASAKWAKFLSIVGCIGVVLLLLLGVVMLFVGVSFSSIAAPFGPLVGFVYLLIAALYIYPIIKGFQFANATKAACLTDDEGQLARGFAGMRALLQFFGILTIIILVLYALVFIGAIFVGMMR